MYSAFWSQLSSNMVDKNIDKPAIETENIYMYKAKVKIHPHTMNDDTISLCECGFKTNKINYFLITHTKLNKLYVSCFWNLG